MDTEIEYAGNFFATTAVSRYPTRVTENKHLNRNHVAVVPTNHTFNYISISTSNFTTHNHKVFLPLPRCLRQGFISESGTPRITATRRPNGSMANLLLTRPRLSLKKMTTKKKKLIPP
ncbi:Hypothetical predicted protein [Octopus vulgaris]|uniref:Uncharacterized protein n=1 Tax=Octopus vulgaris TaxID=6645 RepID=A0AA36BWN2_OCTVU|nr:Hypothetical predicted protein [Octopus vulgaris]